MLQICSSAKFMSTTAISSIAKKEREVTDKISRILEPITRVSLNTLGMIHSVKVSADHSGNLSTQVRLDSLIPGYPEETVVKAACLTAIKEVEGLSSDNDVTFIKRKPKNINSSGENSTLSNVEHVIAVSSCKGGVGKSTVAVHLAKALARTGLRVGILDADVYGPSLPFLVEPDSRVVSKSPKNSKFILPLESKSCGLKLMSFGFVNPKAGVAGAGGKDAAVIRGPIASRVINQLLHATDWGELDYLVGFMILFSLSF